MGRSGASLVVDFSALWSASNSLWVLMSSTRILDAEVGERLRRDGRRCARGRRSGLRIEPFIFAVYAAQRTMPNGTVPPACSSSIAALCLSTCGDTRLDFNDGHVSLAARMCLASNDWMLSSLNRPPCTLGLNAVAPFRADPEPCLESTPNGFVTATAARRGLPGKMADEDFVCPPVSACDHPARRLALCAFHAQLSRRRRSAR